jgi:hypothetical protein
MFGAWKKLWDWWLDFLAVVAQFWNIRQLEYNSHTSSYCAFYSIFTH